MPIPKTRCAYLMLVAALWLAAEVESGGITQTTSLVDQQGVVTMPAAAPQLTFQLRAAFEQEPQNPAGRLLEVKPGVFLGVTTNGGEFSNGTVFVLFRTTSNIWTTRIVHSFSGTDGRNPRAGVIRGHDGNYYGTTSFGGAHNLGTVYRMSASGAVTALYSFAGPDGEEPRAPLVLANDGTLCGAIKARALSDFVAFLKRTTGRQPPSAWYAHVTRLIDLARSRDRESILRALEESEEPALTIYARLERMRVQDVRRADQ